MTCITSLILSGSVSELRVDGESAAIVRPLTRRVGVDPSADSSVNASVRRVAVNWGVARDVDQQHRGGGLAQNPASKEEEHQDHVHASTHPHGHGDGGSASVRCGEVTWAHARP